jgi:hypothetical protein
MFNGKFRDLCFVDVSNLEKCQKGKFYKGPKIWRIAKWKLQGGCERRTTKNFLPFNNCIFDVIY